MGGELCDDMILSGEFYSCYIPHVSRRSIAYNHIEIGYNSHEAIELCLRMLGGGRGPDYDNLQAGFAAGGRISQKINRDPLPPLAYDQTKGSRLHVTIINAVHFASVTGLPNPVSPISAKTYNKLGLPWYKLYDEHIPHANNATTPTPLSDVRSVAQLDRERASRGSSDVQLDCGYCNYEMATIRLQPCGHGMCDSCSTVDVCPSCQVRFLLFLVDLIADHMVRNRRGKLQLGKDSLWQCPRLETRIRIVWTLIL